MSASGPPAKHFKRGRTSLTTSRRSSTVAARIVDVGNWVPVDIETLDAKSRPIHIIAVEIAGPFMDRGPHVGNVLIQRLSGPGQELDVINYRTSVLGKEQP